MSEHHDHRDDCPFKFATLDVCDCVEKNMLDRIEALTAERDMATEGWAEATRLIDVARQQYGAEKSRAEKAETALKEAVGFLAEADRRICWEGLGFGNDFADSVDTFLAKHGEQP